MNNLLEVLQAVKKNTESVEQKAETGITIGLGQVTTDVRPEMQAIWIVNTLPNNILNAGRSSLNWDRVHVVPKNHNYARKLMENYQGGFETNIVSSNRSLCRTLHFIIKSSMNYDNDGHQVTNIRGGMAGDKDWFEARTLQDAIDRLSKNTQEIEEKIKQEQEARRKAEELRRRQMLEEARRMEEEARKAEEQRKALEQERESLIEKAAQQQRMIRQANSLRRNPRLDQFQNAAKFANVLHGPATVINGGPGTGKTTTMIQRLKLLIDRSDLEDFRANNETQITDNDIAVASGKNNWIYFSPNRLLKKYLQENMDYEGLVGSIQKTAVWKDFLQEAVRDYYHLAGDGAPFIFMKSRYEEQPFFIDRHYDFIKDFRDFYIQHNKEKFLRISQIDTSKYSWKVIGKIITNECAAIQSVTSLSALLRFLIHMDSIDHNVTIGGQTMKSGSEMNKEYNAEIQTLATACEVKLRNDKEKYNQLIKLVSDSLKDDDDEDEEEDMEEVVVLNDVGSRINKRIAGLFKKLAFKYADSSVKVSPAQQKVMDIIVDYIPQEKLEELSELAFFVNKVYPALRGSLNNMLSSISRAYKNYRRNLPEELKSHVNADTLAYVMEKSNRPLHSQEQALLVGLINRICRDYYSVKKDDFLNSGNKYVVAYRELCRPVIGIDEATDYTIMDYFGIRSFGHYETESFTLCGDTMQMMRSDGISDWNVLKHPWIFKNLDIFNLTTSYRQSRELMDLAGKIYEEETGSPSPYTCASQESDTPKPLWLQSDDIDDKAEWISARILECVRKFGVVPTTAIFTKDKETGEKLKKAMDDCDELMDAGLKVKVCSESTLEEPKTIRIFPIDEVKGMEFEAVFFYDIDDLESASLVNRFLYVGISRAAMWLAVTSNGRSERINSLLSNYFVQGGDWK